MDETIFASVYLGDARLATHATSANAVWLWSADGSRILWANPAARAALSGKASPGKASPDTALLERVFPIGDPARASQVHGEPELLRLANGFVEHVV